MIRDKSSVNKNLAQALHLKRAPELLQQAIRALHQPRSRFRHTQNICSNKPLRSGIQTSFHIQLSYTAAIYKLG